MDVSGLLEDRTHPAQATPRRGPACRTPSRQSHLGLRVDDTRLRRVFAFIGSTVVASILVILFMELAAYAALSAYHWARPDTQDNFADTSPAYTGYSWATEYWKEEKLRWKTQRGTYEPFRIWGVAPWHSEYINADATDQGVWRRTINADSTSCEKQKPVEVWMFGGSTLYGTGVPDFATLPSYLSRDLHTAGIACAMVSNFGAEGYVTNQELIVLTEQLKAGRRPDLVIFYDGVNDAYAGAVSPGIPNAHISLGNIKARLEGSLAGRLDFLRNSSALQLAMLAANSVRRVHASAPESEETQCKAAAALDNYEANLRMAQTLAQAYGFRVLSFWQPALIYGHKPLARFEMRIAGNEAWANIFHTLNTVYAEAEGRSENCGDFVFLGRIFDSTSEPFYIDKWMHLAPEGNEFVAATIARYAQDSLRRPANPATANSLR
jgi:lysophospholipase L1-like esterase